jgi:hypothetical protein
MKAGDRRTFIVPIRSVREEAADLLRTIEIGQPDVIIRACERLKAALAADDVTVERSEAFVMYVQLRCPKCETVRDNPRATLQDERGRFRNLVNAIGWSMCDACRPKSVPLLEYLDKLEATEQAAGTRFPSGWRNCGGCSAVVVDAHVANPAIREGVFPVSATAVIDHVIATQPRATLALIAKLRECIRAVRMIADGDAETLDWKALESIEVPS